MFQPRMNSTLNTRLRRKQKRKSELCARTVSVHLSAFHVGLIKSIRLHMNKPVQSTMFWTRALQKKYPSSHLPYHLFVHSYDKKKKKSMQTTKYAKQRVRFFILSGSKKASKLLLFSKSKVIYTKILFPIATRASVSCSAMELMMRLCRAFTNYLAMETAKSCGENTFEQMPFAPLSNGKRILMRKPAYSNNCVVRA